MKNNIKILILLTLLFTAMGLFAQGGSNYSIFGLGDIDVNPGAAYEGLAGTSIAFPMDHSINSLNPALWSHITKTRLMTGYKFNQSFMEDDEDNVLYQNNGKLSGISSIFVIDTSLGVAVSFGINPYSSVNYLISVPVDISYEGLNVTGRTLYEGKGGVSLAYLGGSYNILNNLSVGALAFATFGVINSTVSTSFNDENFFMSLTETENRFKGYGYRLGILYEPVEGFNLGAFTEQHQSFEFEKDLTYASEFQNDTSFVDNLELTLPNAYGAGISYLTGKFRIGADYKIYKLKELNFNQGPNTEFRNLQIFSIGFSRLGSQSLSAHFLDKATYNLGIGYKQLYYKINGQDIDEIYASFGMNIPVVGTSIIDASFTFGSRGTTSNSLVREYYGRLSVDISIGETWFKPFKREY
ncbi:hypothetical protein ACFLSQ_05100 [Bacteroidota bacterium]